MGQGIVNLPMVSCNSLAICFFVFCNIRVLILLMEIFYGNVLEQITARILHGATTFEKYLLVLCYMPSVKSDKKSFFSRLPTNFFLTMLI